MSEQAAHIQACLQLGHPFRAALHALEERTGSQQLTNRTQAFDELWAFLCGMAAMAGVQHGG